MSRAAGPRRWPDLMIGALITLLVGGFGTLLLRPQPTPATTGTTVSEPDPTPSADIPGAPGSTAATGSGAATTGITPAPAQTGTDATATPAGTAAGATDPAASAPTTPASTDAASTDASNTGAGSTGDPATPVIAAAPIGTPDPALTGAGGATDPAATTDPATPATDTAASTGAPAARAGGAVPTSEQRTPLRSDYRITLGTFSSGAAAQQAAQGVSALGYTVYPIDVGSTVVAQVGPFADETTAREALADVQRAYPGAILYPPRNRALNTPATSQTEGNQSASQPTTDTTPPAQPATSSDPTYLQVGAFDRLESAQNLVQQLRDLNYNPTVNAPAGKKVTVLVGPYTGDPLTRTEARLKANGIDSFRVR